MRQAAFRNGGFTLAELLVASTISAFVAMVAVGALKTVSESAHRVTAIAETADEVRFAARLISQDLGNLYRNSTRENMRLICTHEQTDQGGVPVLTLYTVCKAKARADQSEADVYEVSYFLSQTEDKTVLFRRLWPYPDPNADPGGILVSIAEDISVFNLRFFDGTEWSTEWPEDMETLPELVEVTIAGQCPNSTRTVIESFIVNFVRLQAPSTTTTTTQGEQGTQAAEGQQESGTTGQTSGQTGGQTDSGTGGTSSGGSGSGGGR